jgi:hypothetical protein
MNYTTGYDWMDVIVIVLAIVHVGIAFSNLFLGCICTAAGLLGKFPARGVIIFWMWTLACSLPYLISESYSGIILNILFSPALLVMFWYFDKAHSTVKST